MISLAAFDSDLQLIADTYVQEREAGAQDCPAFEAAVEAYRGRHPEASECDAALIVCNLMQELPRANNA
jgi:hypothetical protein